MLVTDLNAPSPLSTAAQAHARGAAEDLYEFRRYDYSAGWDDDDADLGWVDEEIVSKRRRLH